jgi:uncharacterized peroxidase-related enzyme
MLLVAHLRSTHLPLEVWMGHLSSLPQPTHLADVIKAFPNGWPDLLRLHDAILRGDGPLSVGERELLAAYVSGINACRFCFNAHTVYAEAFGIAADVFEPLMIDIGTAPVDAKMRPMLEYARALTLSPATVSRAHVQAILDAGWSEAAVAEAAKVVALFNFMNRIVSGMGVDPFDESYARRRDALRSAPGDQRPDSDAHTYTAYGRQLGITD